MGGPHSADKPRNVMVDSQAAAAQLHHTARATSCLLASRDRVLTSPFTPMERLLYIDFYETSAKVGQRVGHAEVKECIGVYGHALVHESRDRAKHRTLPEADS